MSETKYPFAVSLDEVVDPDAFRTLAINAELGLLRGNPEEAEGEYYGEV
jgi:hypothetical protein